MAVLVAAALAGCMGAAPADGIPTRAVKRRPIDLQVLLGPEEEVRVLFIPFQDRVVSGKAWLSDGPDPMDTPDPIPRLEARSPDVPLEPEEIPLEASTALFREALEVLAAQEAVPPQRLAAPSRPVLAVEQVANLRRPRQTARTLTSLEVVPPTSALDADPSVASGEVRLGVLAPRPRRSPERIRLEPRIVRTPGHVGDL